MSQATRFVEGSLWMVGMRWAIRAAGLVSTVILARILTPEDFGIVAMSSLLMGLLAVFSELGTWQLLIRTGETDRRAYDTAWTIMLIQSVALALMLFLLSVPAAAFFNEPRLTAVIRVVAIGSIVSGFVNIGTVMFRRDLDFRSDFLLGFYSKVVTVIPTIILALVYRSYWALVAGTIFGHVLEVIVSYRVHPFRPRLGLHGWRRFVAFSVWTTPAYIANYLNKKADVFVVGHLASAAQMGAYNVASELSRMATAEIVMPMARAIFPNFAKLKDDRAALTRAFLLVLRTVAIVSFSFGFGIAAVADDVVHLVLGDQWTSAVPLMTWLGIFGAFVGVQTTVAGQILIVVHKERSMLAISGCRLVVFSASVLVAAHLGSVVDIAMAAALSTAAVTVISVWYLGTVLSTSAPRMLFEIGRFLGAAWLTFVVVRTFHTNAIDLRAVTLAIDILVGTAFFSLLIGLMWIAEGRPDGPEQRVVNLLSTRWKALKART